MFVGLLSYQLYLYHNPIFSAIDYSFKNEALEYKLYSLPAIVLLSYCSYVFSETPARNKLLIGKRAFYSVLSVSVFVMLGTGYLAHESKGFLEYFRYQLVKNGGVTLVDVEYEKELIDAAKGEFYPSDTEFACLAENCKKILVLGDSFSADAYLSLQSLNNRNVSVRRIFLDDTCLRSVSNLVDGINCNGRNVDLSLTEKADIVLVTASWQEDTYLGAYDFAKLVSTTVPSKVILMGSVVFEDLTSFSFKTAAANNDAEQTALLAYSNQRFDRLGTSNKLREMVDGDSDIEWIEKSEFFCSEIDLKCYLFEDGLPLIWDHAHLTTRAYEEYGAFLYELIVP